MRYLFTITERSIVFWCKTQPFLGFLSTRNNSLLYSLLGSSSLAGANYTTSSYVTTATPQQQQQQPQATVNTTGGLVGCCYVNVISRIHSLSHPGIQEIQDDKVWLTTAEKICLSFLNFDTAWLTWKYVCDFYFRFARGLGWDRDWITKFWEL